MTKTYIVNGRPECGKTTFENFCKDILEDRVDTKYLCSKEFTYKISQALHGDLNKIHGYRLTDYRGGNALHSWELDLKGKCSEDDP